MFCAEPWGYDAVIHEREQTYHRTGVGLELWLPGANAVSLLLSRFGANTIDGGGHLLKSAPSTLRLVPLFGEGEPVVEGEIEVGVV